MTVTITGDDLTFADVLAVARADAPVALAPSAYERLRVSRAHVDAVADGERPVYGITTGFGGLARVLILAADRVPMQHAILRSHAAGIGPPVEREVVRAMILLRAATPQPRCRASAYAPRPLSTSVSSTARL